jgi:hypothetical protein
MSIPLPPMKGHTPKPGRIGNTHNAKNWLGASDMGQVTQQQGVKGSGPALSGKSITKVPTPAPACGTTGGRSKTKQF